MSGLITPQGGNSPAAQSTNSLAQALATITGMAPTSLPSVTPQQVGNAQATASQFAGQEKQNVAQATQSLQQQAGIPQLQGQQQDLGKIFQLYLADQNLSQKYAAPQLSTPNSPIFNNPNLTPNKGIYTGDTSAVPNPYLAKPSDLINAVTQPSGQGFQGFTTPGLNTQAMGQVPGAASDIINLLQSALGQENQLVSGKTGEYTQAYESQANLLQKIADIFQGVYQSQQAAKSGSGGGFGSGSLGEAASAFSDILDKVQTEKGGAATEYDVWNYINQHQSLYKDEGINVDELWKLHKDLVSKVGKGGAISAGTKTVKTPQDQKKAAATALGKLDAVRAAYKKYLQTRSPSDLQNYKAQRVAFADAYAYSLNKSRADASVRRVISQLPDPDFSTEMPFTARVTNIFGGEGGFDGAQTQILSDVGAGSRQELSGGGTPSQFKIIQVQ